MARYQVYELPRGMGYQVCIFKSDRGFNYWDVLETFKTKREAEQHFGKIKMEGKNESI